MTAQWPIQGQRQRQFGLLLLGNRETGKKKKKRGERGREKEKFWLANMKHFRRAFAIRDQEYGHNPVGPDFFGLRKSTISKMIQDLPNARKCSQYTWQTFEPSKCNKPGKNRRRVATDVMGGVNYGLTGNRSMNNIPTQYASRYERR